MFLQVCEAYAVHRETFYLAQDYFDRFLLVERNLKLGVLQLIVLTCLLIASKMEVKLLFSSFFSFFSFCVKSKIQILIITYSNVFICTVGFLMLRTGIKVSQSAFKWEPVVTLLLVRGRPELLL